MKTAVTEAMRALVGLALIQPEIVPQVTITPDQLGHAVWRRAWESIQALDAAGDVVTTETVLDELERRNVNGERALEALQSAVMEPGIASAVDGYCDIIRRDHLTRRVREAASEVLEAHRKGTTGEELLDMFQAMAGSIEAGANDRAKSIGAIVRKRFEELDKLADAKNRGEAILSGIATGVDALDSLLGGLQRGYVTVAAGRPGMGKSAFAQGITDAASAAGHGVYVASLEDGESPYADRALARRSRVDGERIRRAELRKGDLVSLGVAAEELHKRRGWVVDGRSGLAAEDIIRGYRSSRRDNKTELVIVDYLQMVKGCYGDKAMSGIEHAMTALSDAAKADNVAIIVLSQLNRSLENRDDKRPRLSDLRQSGAIEERAKCVLFLYRPAVYDKRAPGDLIEVNVAKNNHGKTGAVKANWDGATARVY